MITARKVAANSRAFSPSNLVGRAASGWLKRVLRSCGLALMLTACSVGVVHATELVVPAYYDPTAKNGLWSDLASTASSVATTVIMNPNSGPGTAQNANYVLAIAKVRLAGGKVIGYVSTRASKRALSDVIKDINLYFNFYKIDGIFIDEMTSDKVTSHIQYYQSIYNYVKGLSSAYTVMGNPGTSTQELYVSLPTADKFVVFEDSAKQYKSYKQSTWQANYAKSRFINMVYANSADQLSTVMTYANTHGAGGVFVTSGTLPNPYKALPSYWSQEITLARSLK